MPAVRIARPGRKHFRKASDPSPRAGRRQLASLVTKHQEGRAREKALRPGTGLFQSRNRFDNVRAPFPKLPVERGRWDVSATPRPKSLTGEANWKWQRPR